MCSDLVRRSRHPSAVLLLLGRNFVRRAHPAEGLGLDRPQRIKALGHDPVWRIIVVEHLMGLHRYTLPIACPLS